MERKQTLSQGCGEMCNHTLTLILLIDACHRVYCIFPRHTQATAAVDHRRTARQREVGSGFQLAPQGGWPGQNRPREEGEEAGGTRGGGCGRRRRGAGAPALFEQGVEAKRYEAAGDPGGEGEKDVLVVGHGGCGVLSFDVIIEFK